MDHKMHDLVAVDIAKNELCVLSAERTFTLANNSRGLRALQEHLGTLKSPWVFCEATGGYERDLVGMLHEQGILVTVVNPARVRYFARSEGMKAKNDPIDTRMILRFAQQKNLSPSPPPPRPELTALMDRRTHLSDELTREKTRLQNSPKLLHASMRRMIRVLEREQDRIEQAIRAQLKEDVPARRAADLMQQTKGVGQVTAWAILAYLPEITQLSRNRIVAMAGLAPFDRDSGTSNGPRHIFGGRQKVRNVLYMAAMCASSHNPLIKQYADRADARGKTKKWIYTAVMRKLLIHLQRTLKNHQLCLVS
jgi:transposase